MDLYKAIQDLYAEKEKLERVIASLEELQRTAGSLPMLPKPARKQQSVGFPDVILDDLPVGDVLEAHEREGEVEFERLCQAQPHPPRAGDCVEVLTAVLDNVRVGESYTRLAGLTPHFGAD